MSPYSTYNYDYGNHNLDSPYSVQSYATRTSSSTKNTASLSSPASRFSSAYDGDNESQMVASGSTSKAPTSLQIDVEFERRASYTGPNARAVAMLEQTLSAPGGGIRRDGSKLLERKKDIKREFAANVRALSLMDVAAAGPKQQRSLSNDGRNEIQCLKSETDVSRQARAECRALYLLKNTVTKKQREQDPQQQQKLSVSGKSTVNHLKSETDIARQTVAEWRALCLLQNTVTKGRKNENAYEAMSLDSEDGSGSCEENPRMDISEEHDSESRMNRHSYAKHRATRLQREKAEMNAKLQRDKQKFGRVPPRVSVPSHPELLAETTRPRAKTAEDVRDPETVAGMKCHLDIEREQWARAKALRLLNCGRGSIS